MSHLCKETVQKIHTSLEQDLKSEFEEIVGFADRYKEVMRHIKEEVSPELYYKLLEHLDKRKA